MAVTFESIPLFQGLSKADSQKVRECLKEKDFQAGEILHSEGAACERIFIVKSGRIKLYRTASNGREQILETFNSGDTCACNPGELEWSCMTTAEAITPCTVWFLARDRYIQLVQSNNKLAQTLNRLFAEKLRCFSFLIEEVSLKDTRKRLVKFLLDMLAHNISAHHSKSVLFIPFTREEIAQRIGAARETVARHLSEFKEAQLIELKPHQIVIRDKEGLEKLLR